MELTNNDTALLIEPISGGVQQNHTASAGNWTELNEVSLMSHNDQQLLEEHYLIVPPNEAITQSSCEMQDPLNCEVQPMLQCRLSVNIDGQQFTLILLSDTVVSNTNATQEHINSMLSQNTEGCTSSGPQETETLYISAALLEDIEHSTHYT